jgi:hypothetical protein
MRAVPLNPAIDLLVRSIPILIGGGTVQLVIFIIKRRSEMRAMDAASAKNEAESGSFVITSAARSLELSDQVRDRAVARAERLETEVQRLTERLHTVEGLLSGVEELRAQVSKLSEDNVKLRAEVEICRRTHPRETV